MEMMAEIDQFDFFVAVVELYDESSMRVMVVEGIQLWKRMWNYKEMQKTIEYNIQ